MKSPNAVPRLRSILAVCVIAASSLILPEATVEADQGDLASVGLTTFWEANVGGVPLANGPRSFVIWPHTSEKREYVTVRNGGRVIERINGSEIDLKAIEEAITQGEKLAKPPTIGLEGAKAKASKLVATYKTLGRTLEMEPHSQRLVYVISLASNGILETIDAETGGLIWKTEVGKSTLPMFGPGVSDEYVAVTNGNQLFVYELATGNAVMMRTLAFTPTSAPSVVLGKAIVPSVDGRLVSYDIKSKTIAPAILRSGIENRLGATISANHQFLAWPTGDKLVLARMEKNGIENSVKKADNIPRLWASASVSEKIVSPAVATQDGFLASSSNGTVMHCSLAREGTLLWKTRLAVPISQSPLVNKDLAFLVSEDGFLFALRISDGSDAWGHQPANIKNMIAVGKKNIYVKDARNTLVSIDLATGLESTRTNTILPSVVPNSISDRLFLVTSQGQVTCLRETDATVPSFSTDFEVTTKTAPPTASKLDEDKKKPADMDAEANPFGEGTTETAGNPFDTGP